MRNLLLVTGLGALLCSGAAAEQRQLLWGDTHLHTTYSSDAYTNNNLTADPEDAFRYAMGMPVIHPYHRARIQIGTPLDFLVVSDHAELMGVIRHIHREGVITDGMGPWDSIKARFAAWVLGNAIDDGEGRALFSSVLPPPKDPREVAAEASLSDGVSMIPDMMSVQVDTWKTITDIAERYNDPGNFSALIGWEWSSIPGGANLHRIVVTDGDAASAQQYQPWSLSNSPYPEDLWQWLEKTSSETGADFIAIPHNSNISKGYMFDEVSLRGEAFTEDYIASRMRWERIAEITQIKGDSETHPVLSPADEFADFEEYPFYIQNGYTPYDPQPGDYIRSALKRGLAMGRELGTNPYQFGVIGSTDSHTAMASAEEDNFHGKLATDSIPENKQRKFQPDHPSSSGWAMSASGLAAVWATENTREAILEAMRRREVYATTGPRIGVQFFGGADFTEADLEAADLYAHATARGVAMGGELSGLAAAPTFLVLANRDPVGANLDRVQIVKGWLDAGGEQHEQVYNVAWSGDRQPGPDGRLPAVGNTVDVSNASWNNSIGSGQLAGVWRDPDFDAGQSAFYYVRVLQIPTPRHSLYDALALELEHAAEQPDTIQERAYTSSIWYSP
jgi:hypothetical protein